MLHGLQKLMWHLFSRYVGFYVLFIEIIIKQGVDSSLVSKRFSRRKNLQLEKIVKEIKDAALNSYSLKFYPNYKD